MGIPLWDDLTGVTDARAAQDRRMTLAEQAKEAERARQFMRGQAEKGFGFIDKGSDTAKRFLSRGYDQGAEAQTQSLGDQLAAYGGANQQARADIESTPTRLSDLYGGGLGAGFEGDPGYQFRLKQGQDALMHAASARGGRHGGDTLKALSEYNQNFASNEFDRYANRQIGMAQGADQSDFARNQSLSNLATMHGAQAGGAYGNYGNQMSNMATQQGAQLGNLYSNAGTNKANVAVGVGGNNTALSQNMMSAYGNQQPTGNSAQSNAMMNAALIAMSMYSDERLKEDIQEIEAPRFERLGLRGYRWRWNKIAKSMGLSGEAEGVIAQEVLRKFPQAVGRRGEWLTVDYGQIERLVAEDA